MARFEDYSHDSEVKDIVEKYVKKFPQLFSGFKANDIFFIVTLKKSLRGKHPINVKTVPYPHYVYGGYTYIFETFDTKWQKFSQKQKNLAVFHAMCAIPEGGFDNASTHYGKKVKPDYEMYAYEFAVSGGVPNWYENDDAQDPMDVNPDDIQVEVDEEDEDPIPSPKTPATPEAVATAVMDEEEAVAS
jgi:hypothetical protein